MNILKKLYPNICTLDVYLTRLFGVSTNGELGQESVVWWKHTNDSAAFQLLLSSTLVCYRKQPVPLPMPTIDTTKNTASISRHTKVGAY
jgi:hypothetical protein